MKGLYPARLGYLQPTDIEILEQELTVAHITWDYPSNSGNQTGSGGNGVNSVLNSTNTRRRRASGSVHETYGNRTVFHTDQRHSLEEDIAHALHKASISILGILVVEVKKQRFAMLCRYTSQAIKTCSKAVFRLTCSLS